MSFGFDNDGVVDLDSTSLHFTGGATGSVSTGSWTGTAVAPPTLRGAFTLGGGGSIGNSLVVDAGAAVSINSSDSATVGSLTLRGTVAGGGQLRVRDSFSMSGSAVISGTGSLVVESTASGGISDGTINGATLRNEGSLTQSGTARLWGKNGAVLDNRGTYTLNTARCSGCSYDVGVLWTPASGEKTLAEISVLVRQGDEGARQALKMAKGSRRSL